MGFFSINYNKPGPGVDKDAPPKPRFFIFFDVLKRKFWHLLKINFMYVLFNIPALIIAFMIALNLYSVTTKAEDIFVTLYFAVVMTVLPLITMGPVQAGITYILRNYSREQHSFIWWDFKEHFVKNFKQGAIITFIDIIVTTVFIIAIKFYAHNPGTISLVATSMVVLSIVIFAIMHFYIYPMLVTVNLSIKNIYKNAFIFAIIKLIPNVLFFILNLAIVYAAFYYVIIGMLLYVLILPTFIGLMNNFYANPIIKKYVITEPEVSEEEDDDDDDGEGFYKKVVDGDEDEK